jgi:hypothetical protein
MNISLIRLCSLRHRLPLLDRLRQIRLLRPSSDGLVAAQACRLGRVRFLLKYYGDRLGGWYGTLTMGASLRGIRRAVDGCSRGARLSLRKKAVEAQLSLLCDADHHLKISELTFSTYSD